MEFKLTVTLGEVLQMGAVLVAVTAVIIGVRVELRSVKRDIRDFADRMARHETTIFTMFGQLQRVVGVLDRRQVPRE